MPKVLRIPAARHWSQCDAIVYLNLECNFFFYLYDRWLPKINASEIYLLNVWLAAQFLVDQGVCAFPDLHELHKPYIKKYENDVIEKRD